MPPPLTQPTISALRGTSGSGLGCIIRDVVTENGSWSYSPPAVYAQLENRVQYSAEKQSLAN